MSNFQFIERIRSVIAVGLMARLCRSPETAHNLQAYHVAYHQFFIVWIASIGPPLHGVESSPNLDFGGRVFGFIQGKEFNCILF